MFELIDMIIVRPITNILFVIYGLVGDFGIAIILFTVLVKLLMWPLIKGQLRQVKLMRKLQPELAKIKKQSGGNRQLESLQMMDLYKRYNVKPFRSILTLIIQLPIFIALYTAIQVMVVPTTADNLGIRAYEPVRQFENISTVIEQQESYLADPQNNTYDFHPQLFGLINLDTRVFAWTPSSYVILVFALLAAFCQYWSMRQQMPSGKSQKRRKFREILAEVSESGKEPDQTELNNIIQTQMSKIMPLFMLFIMIQLPGALVFYYLLTSAFSIVQQHIILNRDEDSMEMMADKSIIRELNKIQEGEVVKNKKTGTTITRISARDLKEEQTSTKTKHSKSTDNSNKKKRR